MKNWLGQDIQVGSIVGHARNAYSDMEIGKVFKIDGRVARVYWLYYEHASVPYKSWAKKPGVPSGGGPLDVDRLLLIDPATLDFDPNDWWSE